MHKFSPIVILSTLCIICAGLLTVGSEKTFNFDLATESVRVAISAYCGNKLVNSTWDCYWCRTFPGFNFVGSWNNETRTVFGFSGYYKNVIYVVWRGTVLTDYVGWLENFDITQVPYLENGIKVHEGFLLNYQAVQAEARYMVQQTKIKCPLCDRVVVTGHSLGAAVATLNVLDIADWLNFDSEKISLMAFSGPRVGNSKFSDYFSTKILDSWRIVNGRDTVPHVPMEILGYKHISSEEWFDGENWHTCYSGEDSKCSNSYIVFNPFDHAVIMGYNLFNGVTEGCLIYKNNFVF